jgi:hypothetical protein
VDIEVEVEVEVEVNEVLGARMVSDNGGGDVKGFNVSWRP